MGINYWGRWIFGILDNDHLVIHASDRRVNVETIAHRYLICNKVKTREKRWSGICKVRLQCAWLRFDEQGIAQCDFTGTADKRAEQFKAKKKEKQETS